MESPSHAEDTERVRQGRLELRERYATGHKEFQARKDAVQRQLSPAPEAEPQSDNGESLDLQQEAEERAQRQSQSQSRRPPPPPSEARAEDHTRKCPESHGGKGKWNLASQHARAH